jgi:autotransporter-associated beta strand protein
MPAEMDMLFAGQDMDCLPSVMDTDKSQISGRCAMKGWGRSGAGRVQGRAMVCGLLLGAWGGATVQAATTNYTWRNTSGDRLWNTTSINWRTGSTDVVWFNDYSAANGSCAIFGTTGTGAVTVANGAQANKITVNASATGYVLQGGSLEIGAGGLAINESARIETPITNKAEQTWTMATGKTLTLTSNVTATLKFTLTGGTVDFFGIGSFNIANHWVTYGRLNVLTGGVCTIDTMAGGTLISGTIDVNGGLLRLDGTHARSGYNCGMYLGGNWYGGGDVGTLTVRNGGLVEVLRYYPYAFMLGDANTTNGTSRGTINIDAGGVFLSARQFVRGYNQATNAATINFDGGTLKASTNVASWVGTNVTVNIKNGGAIIDTQAFNATNKQPLLAYGGNSTGGLRKVGSGTLTLSGTNTYNGATDVVAGTLRLTSPECLSTNTDLFLTTGATVHLAFTGTNTVHALYIDGTPRLARTFGAGSAPGLTGPGYLLTLWPIPRGTIFSVR